jgi:tetratricopeptide (TPR) repeat protein
LKINPRDAYSLGYRAAAFSEKGDLRKAVADYTVALAIEPAAGGFYNRGYARARLKEFDGAIAD